MTQLGNLSVRESQVVTLLLQGLSNKLIASALHISERTVEFHLKNIFTKYQVSSRVELILKLGESTVAQKQEIAENLDLSYDFSKRARLWVETISLFVKELKMKASQYSNADSENRPMTFFESILICFRKFADFNGTASRSEFWWFTLFVTLVAAALNYINETLSAVFLIAILLPFLAAGSRRLRAIGKSGWWLLFLLVPVGGIVILAYMWAMPPEETISDTEKLQPLDGSSNHSAG